MAITPTNSNTVNIVNLPKSQLAVGSDLLVLQTTNGTQTITFDNFNVVKTDVSGNATVTGVLSGKSSILNTLLVNSITAGNFTTPAGPGTTLPTGFYNQFSIQNGLILSATSNVQQDPTYLQLYSQDIPLYVSSILKGYGVSTVIQGYGNILIPAGSTTAEIFVDSFFKSPPQSYANGQITPAHISLTSDFVPTLSSVLITSILSPSTLSALSALSQLAYLSGGFEPGSNSSILNVLTGSDFNNLVNSSTITGTVNIPYNVTPIITPNTIRTYTSSSGINDGLTFEVNIGVSQSVDVTVYWILNIVIPLTVIA